MNIGTQVILRFDTNTNRGESKVIFACDELLLFRGNTESICSWIDDISISIKPSAKMLDSNKIQVNDKIEYLISSGSMNIKLKNHL